MILDWIVPRRALRLPTNKMLYAKLRDVQRVNRHWIVVVNRHWERTHRG